jgi:hypothetical protein
MLDEAQTELHERTKACDNDPTQDEQWLLRRLAHYAQYLFPSELMLRRTQFAGAILTLLSNDYKKPLIIQSLDQYQLLLDTLDQPAVDPASLFPEVKYDGPFEELIEKLVLLYYLDSTDFLSYTVSNVHILRLMYGGQFKQSRETVETTFVKAKSKYSPVLKALLTQELHCIKELPGTGRSTIDLMTHSQDILDRTADFTIEVIQNAEHDKRISALLTQQIEVNIFKKLEAGISQARELRALKQMDTDGELNTYNTQVVRRLVAEANAQLKLLRLPQSLKKYERLVVSNIQASQLLTANFTPQDSTDSFLYDTAMPIQKEVGGRSKALLKQLGVHLPDENIEITEMSEDEIQRMGGELVLRQDVDPTPYGAKSEYFRKNTAEIEEGVKKLVKFSNDLQEEEKA